MATEIAGYHDVPKHCPAEAVGGCSAEAHQPFATPEAHHSVASGKQPTQLVKTSAPGPKRMAIKKPLQLQQCPAGAKIWT